MVFIKVPKLVFDYVNRLDKYHFGNYYRGAVPGTGTFPQFPQLFTQEGPCANGMRRSLSNSARGILCESYPRYSGFESRRPNKKQSSMPERKERAAMIQTVIYVINMLRILYAEGDESEE